MGDDRLITRRRFVAGTAASAAAAAGGATGAPADAARRKQRNAGRRRIRRRQDVVVVGGGLAGLVAAREVARAGRSVAVLEARARVGGRMFDRAIAGGEVVELGAEFIGPTQNRIRALVDELAIETFAAYNEGRNAYYAGGRRSLYSDAGLTGSAPSDPALLVDLLLAIPQLNALARKVPVVAPWEAPNAGGLDSESLEIWLRRNSTGGKRFMDVAKAATRAIFGAEPRELSLLFVAFYIAASGDESTPGTFERNFNTRNGAQQHRIAGGAQQIAERVAQGLGRRVIRRSPVRRIVMTPGYVDVISDRYVNRAKQVIVALPPVLAGRIQYEPALPSLRDGLTQRLAQGHLIKVQAIYERPFWRGDGLNGASIADVGAVQRDVRQLAALGHPGRGARVRRRRRGAVVRQAGGAGAPERGAWQLRARVRRAGAEPDRLRRDRLGGGAVHARCPVGIAPPGLLTTYGRALREPVERLHWAGTESSTYWNGYMDGAVRSGERAAREALAAL